MHTYARIHTRVELKLAAWEEDKARGCVNSLLVSVAKKDLSFEQNGEKGREKEEGEGKRERERQRRVFHGTSAILLGKYAGCLF